MFVCLSQCCCCFCCCSLCLIAASVDDLFRLVCYPTVSLLSRSVSRLGLGHSRSLCVEWIAACSFCARVIASLCLSLFNDYYYWYSVSLQLVYVKNVKECLDFKKINPVYKRFLYNPGKQNVVHECHFKQLGIK